jgi:putative ABC transport system permease protein
MFSADKRGIMLKNYLKIVIRNIVRHKGFTFVNISGLAIGIAVASLIMLFVKYEWEYDKCYPNTNSIYRVIQRQEGNVFMGTDYFAVTQEPLGRTLQSELPEVNNYVTLKSWKEVVVDVDHAKNFEEDILYATAPNLFKIFSFEFAAGNPNTVLSEPNSVILSENIARKFYGNESPIGKTITVRGKDVWTVTGVFKSMPANSQFANYGMITSFETYALTVTNRERSFQWSSSSWYTYLLLKDGTNPKYLQDKFPSVVEKFLTKPNSTGKPRELYLQPLKDIHLYNKANFEFGENGDIKIILILIAIAFIMLTIACINYTNLSTARASLRAREVGIRKVIGAGKIQLVSQFIGDSMILSLTAGIFALILDVLFLPSFDSLIGIDLGSTSIFQPSFLIGFIILTVLVGLSSGVYPAFVLSNYQPARVLKGDKAKGDRSSLRRILVITQFTASIALIACTFVILSQMNYIKTKNLGYNRENIIVLPLNDDSVVKQLEAMKNELNLDPAIVGVTASSSLPINIDAGTSIQLPGEANTDGVRAYQVYADYNFIKIFNIKIVEGRDFSRLISTDSTNAVLINQSLAKSFGVKSAIGNTIKVGNEKFSVIGVMKDFNMHSLHHEILPLFVELSEPWKQYLSIKVRPNDLPATINFIKSVWNRYSKLMPFNYTFLDSDFNSLYKAEERLTQIVTYSSFLAIFISCLGLFGLVSFIVEQRRKEIGIRKVLGASVSNVVGTLSKQFLLIVLLANIIALPLAYYFMNGWLEDFAYRINISWWMFILSGGIAFLIALATVSIQAIKAATANPVESLRYE